MIGSCCQKHQKKPFRVLSTMSRVPSPMAHRFLLQDYIVTFKDFEGRCVQAEVANAISLIVGKGSAEGYWPKDY